MPTRVRELMTSRVATISRGSALHDLERLLVERRIHGVPVVDEADRIVGVVSQSDLLTWHYATSAGTGGEEAEPDARRARVEEIMSPLVHCIAPERTLAEAAVRMLREHIHRLVVVDDEFRVVGILAAVDLLRALPGVEPRADPTLDRMVS
jgi:CBS-domain-containing membrane protein